MLFHIISAYNWINTINYLLCFWLLFSPFELPIYVHGKTKRHNERLYSEKWVSFPQIPYPKATTWLILIYVSNEWIYNFESQFFNCLNMGNFLTSLKFLRNILLSTMTYQPMEAPYSLLNHSPKFKLLHSLQFFFFTMINIYIHKFYISDYFFGIDKYQWTWQFTFMFKKNIPTTREKFVVTFFFFSPSISQTGFGAPQSNQPPLSFCGIHRLHVEMLLSWND